MQVRLKERSPEELTFEQKEVCGILAMRTMLCDYAKASGCTFEEALSEFALSKTYSELFDFETRLWAEGPDYLFETWKLCG